MNKYLNFLSFCFCTNLLTSNESNLCVSLYRTYILPPKINIIYVQQKLLPAIQDPAHNSIFKVPAMTHVPTFERERAGEGGISHNQEHLP